MGVWETWFIDACELFNGSDTESCVERIVTDHVEPVAESQVWMMRAARTAAGYLSCWAGAS